jgi:preprotein translocase subunit SecY
MKSTTKIITIIGVFFIGGLLIAFLKESTGNSKGGGGPIGVIIAFGIIAAIRAIWKHNSESENKKDSSADNQHLDKR